MKNATVTAVVPTTVDSELEALTTTSAKIRHLTTKGLKRGEIAKQLGIRYQHVRNVQMQPLKKVEAK